MYKPKRLNRWTLPRDYFGAHWPDYYSAGVGQSRDSDCLEQSNFAKMLELLGGESETVLVVNESHWAVGWVEWIAIHESDTAALDVADKAQAHLEDYPVLDDENFSQREWDRAANYWNSLSPRDKVRTAMEERKRYHWLAKEPVWRFGRLDYDALANDGSTIAEALLESLRCD